MKVIPMILVVSLFGCEKEIVIDELTKSVQVEQVEAEPYFAYDVNDIEQVIQLANENYVGNTNSQNRAPGGPTIEVDFSGRYFDIIDPAGGGSGVGRCFLPANICGIIITAGEYISNTGETTVYRNSDIIKMYPDLPVRESYDKITVIHGPTTNSPDALSTFIFE